MTSTDALDIGKGLPALLLRAVIGLVGAGVLVVLGPHGTSLTVLLVLGVPALAAVLAPASPAPGLLALIVGLFLLVEGGDPLRAEVLLAIPLVHLLHVTCAIAGLVPARARIHPAALRAPAVRFLTIQAGTFALVGVAALIPVGRTPAVLELVALLGVALLTLLVVRLLNRPQ